LTGVIVSLPGGGAPRRRTISDSKGRFVFAGLAAAERYSLEGEKPGYVAAALARRGPLFSSGTRVALANGEWIADANFPMLRLGAINGAAVDERGEPVLNVPVRILTRVPLAGGMRLASGPSARTDDRGVYWIAGLMAGSCFVAVLSVQSVVPPSTAPGVAAGLSPLEVTLGVARFRRWLASTSRESGW
jgi:hypothetical protein